MIALTDVLSLVLIGFAVMGCLSLLAFQGPTGVPPMSSSAAEAADAIALLRQAGLPEGAIIYELGCGWGALVLALAKAFPTAHIRGVELSPFPYWIARLRTRKRPNVSIHWGNVYQQDLRDADAVTCCLMINSMPKISRLLDEALRPGTPVISLRSGFGAARLQPCGTGQVFVEPSLFISGRRQKCDS